jgi:hypothetical protein
MKELLFVSCTQGVKEDTVLYASLQKLGATAYRFVEHNREGLSICYNRVLNELAGGGQIIVFVHDDVTISDVYVREKLNDAVSRLGFTVVGLAGSARFDLQLQEAQTLWYRTPPEHKSGAVEHRWADGSDCWMVLGPTPRQCAVLDGLFLAVDAARIGPVRFDEQFAFHFYDIDFCLSAYLAGLTLGTTNVYVNHRSFGSFESPAFYAMQELFRRKWQGRLNPG